MEVSRSVGARAFEPVVEFDPDDMLGVRRAWALVPERHREAFLARWVQLTESCDYHVPSIEEVATLEADRWRTVDPAIVQAWLTIGAAMNEYLDWRAAERKS